MVTRDADVTAMWYTLNNVLVTAMHSVFGKEGGGTSPCARLVDDMGKASAHKAKSDAKKAIKDKCA